MTRMSRMIRHRFIVWPSGAMILISSQRNHPRKNQRQTPETTAGQPLLRIYRGEGRNPDYPLGFQPGPMQIFRYVVMFIYTYNVYIYILWSYILYVSVRRHVGYLNWDLAIPRENLARCMKIPKRPYSVLLGREVANFQDAGSSVIKTPPWSWSIIMIIC